MNYSLELTSDAAAVDSAFIMDQLDRFNRGYAEPHRYTLLRIFARDGSGNLIGGLLGGTFYRWLHIETLWINEAHRGEGLGQMLMQRAEQEALSRGCKHAFVDTFEFQAPKFYEKIGYRVWGILEDFPPGHQRIYYQKDLLRT